MWPDSSLDPSGDERKRASTVGERRGKCLGGSRIVDQAVCYGLGQTSHM